MAKKESDRLKGKSVPLYQLDRSGRQAQLQPHQLRPITPASQLNTSFPPYSQAHSSGTRINQTLPSRASSSSTSNSALNQNQGKVTEDPSENAFLGIDLEALESKASISETEHTDSSNSDSGEEKESRDLGNSLTGNIPNCTQTGPKLAQVSTGGQSDSEESNHSQSEKSENRESNSEFEEEINAEENLINILADEVELDQEGADNVELNEVVEEMANLGGITFPNLISAPTLPQFDPERDSVNEFLENFVTIAASLGWKAEQKANMLPLCLNPIARQWYTTYKGNNDPLVWDTLKGEMEKAFAREGDKMKAKRLFRQRKQGPEESIDHYVFDSLRLAKRADSDMKDKKKIDTIIDGLLRPYFEQTYTKTFNTVEELKAHLRGLEDARHTFRTDHFEHAASGKITEEVREMKEMLKKLAVGSSRPRFNNVEAQPETKHVRFASPTRSNDGQPICFICRGVGHISSKCPTWSQRCSYCNKRGHNQRVCFKRQRDLKTSGSGNLQRRT